MEYFGVRKSVCDDLFFKELIKKRNSTIATISPNRIKYLNKTRNYVLINSK